MTNRANRGFTWPELIVVAIIVALLLLLLPSQLFDSRIETRRATCLHNQKQLALSLLNYESSHNCFPGYVNRIEADAETSAIVSSWVPPLFLYLDRDDLFQVWKEGNPVAPVLKVLCCPSQGRESSPTAPESDYVANCGRPGDADTPAHGVFHNHDVDGERVSVSLDYVSQHDGTTYTLLLSENLQAGLWTDTEEADIGMVWHEAAGPMSHINRGKNAGRRRQDIQYARPSSNHPGRVVVSFCDGHQQFLNEDIDYRVYQHLMTPDSNEAAVEGELDPGDF